MQSTTAFNQENLFNSYLTLHWILRERDLFRQQKSGGSFEGRGQRKWNKTQQQKNPFNIRLSKNGKFVSHHWIFLAHFELKRPQRIITCSSYICQPTTRLAAKHPHIYTCQPQLFKILFLSLTLSLKHSHTHPQRNLWELVMGSWIIT